MPATTKKTAQETQAAQETPSPIDETEGQVAAVHPETVEVRPGADAVRAALVEAGERNKAAQSAARRANGMTKAEPKPATKPKAPAKPKAQAKPGAVERVPFDEVNGLLKELGLSKSQLARATGRSNSLVSEWTGSGRKRGLARTDWRAVEAAARKWAKANLR
jgi:DNA-binding transcriptional regulator YiaG